MCKNWSRGVMDYNRRRLKYEHGMLMGGSEKDQGSGRRVLGRGVTPIGEVILKYSGGLGNMYTYFPRISDYYTST